MDGRIEGMKKYKVVASVIVILVIILAIRGPLQNEIMLRTAEKIVRVKVTPSFDFNFEFMKPGVLQHLDRRSSNQFTEQIPLDVQRSG